MFEYSFVSDGRVHRPLMVAYASLGEALFLGIAVLAPLLYVDSIPQHGLLKALLLAPVPTAPPAPAAPILAKRAPRARAPQVFNPHALTSPVVIPREVAMIEEAPAIEVDTTQGVPGGLPGVPGAATGLFGDRLSVAPPPPPPPAPKIAEAAPAPPVVPTRIKVGGDVQAAMLLLMIEPAYPVLAARGHIRGTVKMVAVIGTDGKIKNLSAVSGHPLLVSAALEAVERWTYRPTYLNGVPVEVITEIEVHFGHTT